MSEIWKCPLDIKDLQVITIPEGAVPLTAALQYGLPYLWVRVDPSAPRVDQEVRIYGTGQPVEEIEETYVGTIQLEGFVWHIFWTHSKAL